MEQLQKALKTMIEVAKSLRTNEHKTDWDLNNSLLIIQNAEKVLKDSGYKESGAV